MAKRDSRRKVVLVLKRYIGESLKIDNIIITVQRIAHKSIVILNIAEENSDEKSNKDVNKSNTK